MRVLIVGCGLSGATCAALLKRENQSNEIVLVDCREHIAGNCYDSYLGGILTHNYGPHAFHTDKKHVWDFVNSFVPFYEFKHQVQAELDDGKRIHVPFNNLSVDVVGEWTPEMIQRQLFHAYSEKHWGVAWDMLPDYIRGRVPQRRDDNISGYHLDPYQGLPRGGFHELVLAMLDGCTYYLGITDWQLFRYGQSFDLVIYTGSIDAYFGYTYGTLPYRSLRFEFNHSCPRQQFVQTNFCHHNVKYTRLIDHGHWINYQGHRTVLSREYPEEFDIYNIETDRYYPKQWGEGLSVYSEYKKLAKEDKTIFLGRLGTYKYLDMDDCISQAMSVLRKNHLIS